MRDSLQLKKICWAWLAMMWAASAWAAQVTFVTDLAAIPLAAVAVAILIALIGGSAAHLAKIAHPEVVIKNVLLESLKDMMASLAAGLATFFILAWRESSPLLAAGGILVAGYGGSRVLDRFLGAGLSQIDRLAGKPEGTP